MPELTVTAGDFITLFACQKIEHAHKLAIRERSRIVNRQLRRQGWKVIRILQHALQKSPQTCLNRIRRTL
jgi:very-short-patch-repair endonuclease